MQNFYILFHNQVKNRVNRHNTFTAFGEDSIRYDFYHTAIRYFKLNPIDLIIEQPLPTVQFDQKDRDGNILKQGRHHDKPEFDLRIDPKNKLDKGLIVEFAFFRKTKISKNQDKPGRHGKLMNDIHRLALLKHYKNIENDPTYTDFSKYLCLLVCITDEEMINYGHNRKGTIPIQPEYNLTKNYLDRFPKSVNIKIEKRFADKVNDLRIIPIAKEIFKKTEKVNYRIPGWCTWIWEINYKRGQ